MYVWLRIAPLHDNGAVSGADAAVFRFSGECTGICCDIYENRGIWISVFDLCNRRGSSDPGRRGAEIYHAVQSGGSRGQYGAGCAVYFRV